MNTCTIEGCTKAHRAKGLCSTHYNQTHVASRHQKVEERCDYCGDTTLKAPNQRARWGHVYCSLMCRDLAKIEAGMPMPVAAIAARWAGHETTARPHVAPSSRTCQCGDTFLAVGKTKYCSMTCRNRSRASRRGKRHHIRRLEIFARDSWTCWLCEGHIDPSLKVPHPHAATVDHLVPQSMGGTHEPTNLATAHMSCNSRRGASLTW